MNHRMEPAISKAVLRGALWCLVALQLTACSPAETADDRFSIRLSVIKSKRLGEISGMAASRRTPGLLWVHNDGSDGRLYALSTNGHVSAEFKLQTKVTDLEDIAIGPGPTAGQPHLYVGDMGDNFERREAIRIYRFPEPKVGVELSSKKPIPITRFDTITLRYPAGRHDAEALLVDPLTGDLFVATKQQRRTRIYSVAKEQLQDGGSVILKLEKELGLGNISAGDISPDGREIILRRENAAWIWKREPGESVGAALSRAPQTVPVIGPPREPNGESIAFSCDGQGYYTLSEGQGQTVYFFPRNVNARP